MWYYNLQLFPSLYLRLIPSKSCSFKKKYILSFSDVQSTLTFPFSNSLKKFWHCLFPHVFPFRINTLVEQEVKRRMFEEKILRENFRKKEKEKERIDRAAEIQKIKDMHNRELKQLKDKYENPR